MNGTTLVTGASSGIGLHLYGRIPADEQKIKRGDNEKAAAEAG